VRIQWSPGLIAVLMYMSIIGIAAPYALWFKLLDQGQLSRLVAYLFMTPLFATLLGVVVRGERLSAVAAAGMALTLAGIYVVNRPGQWGRVKKPAAGTAAPAG